MKFAYSALFTMAIAMTAPAFANSELDPSVPTAPTGLIVREDAQGNREIFKAEIANTVKDEATAATAVESFVKNENRIAQVNNGTELDRVSSNEAWYYWYNPYYTGSYYYGYSWYGYNYTYYPYYNWYYGSYRYYYYWY